MICTIICINIIFLLTFRTEFNPNNNDTILVFKLTVTDDKGGSDPAITTVRVVGEPQAKSNLTASQ